MFIIDFKPFTIEKREYIDSFFHVHHYEGIDCSFNTLFLWQEAYHTQWAVEENILFVRAGEGENTFFMPPFAGEGASFGRAMNAWSARENRLSLRLLHPGCWNRSKPIARTGMNSLRIGIIGNMYTVRQT